MFDDVYLLTILLSSRLHARECRHMHVYMVNTTHAIRLLCVTILPHAYLHQCHSCTNTYYESCEHTRLNTVQYCIRAWFKPCEYYHHTYMGVHCLPRMSLQCKLFLSCGIDEWIWCNVYSRHIRRHVCNVGQHVYKCHKCHMHGCVLTH